MREAAAKHVDLARATQGVSAAVATAAVQAKQDAALRIVTAAFVSGLLPVLAKA
jgi:hypothetical protein